MTENSTSSVSPQTTDNRHLPAGTILAAQYKVEEILGSGAIGTVYKAIDLRMETTVAVKLLHKGALGHSKAMKRFADEAKILAALNHPHIVKILAVKLQDEQPFLVMEYLNGIDLHMLIQKDGPLPAERAKKLFAQVADALSYAHKQHVIHRDLKPSNLLILETGTANESVKVVDFGVAKLVDPTQTGTNSGGLVGTLSYMSPEQCSGGKVGAKSDIYALGCVFYETLSGSPPFTAESGLEIMQKQLADPVPNLTNPQLHGLNQIIQVATQKSPADRFQSMGEVSLAINAGRPDSNNVRQLNRPPIRRHSHPRTRIFVAIALLSFLCAGLYLVNAGAGGRRGTASIATPYSSQTCDDLLHEVNNEIVSNAHIDQVLEELDQKLEAAERSKRSKVHELRILALKARLGSCRKAPLQHTREQYQVALDFAEHNLLHAPDAAFLLAETYVGEHKTKEIEKILVHELEREKHLGHVSSALLVRMIEQLADAIATDGARIDEALNWYRQIPECRLDRETLKTFAEAQWMSEKGQYRRALELMRAWQVKHENKEDVDLYTKAKARNTIAYYLLNLGDCKQAALESEANLKAVKLCNENDMTVAEQSKLWRILAFTHLRLARALTELKQPDEALKHLTQSRLFAQRGGFSYFYYWIDDATVRARTGS